MEFLLRPPVSLRFRATDGFLLVWEGVRPLRRMASDSFSLDVFLGRSFGLALPSLRTREAEAHRSLEWADRSFWTEHRSAHTLFAQSSQRGRRKWSHEGQDSRDFRNSSARQTLCAGARPQTAGNAARRGSEAASLP